MPSGIIPKDYLNKAIYLDTNIIFRALGLNGISYEKKITLFLDKCMETGQRLVITDITESEFENTLLKQCQELKDFSKTTSTSYNYLADENNIQAAYLAAKKNKPYLNPDFYRAESQTNYQMLIEKYSIEKENSIDYDQEQCTIKVNSLYEYKYINEYNCSSKETCKTDIWNLEHILDKNINGSINSDAIFITSDNKLLSWTSVKGEYNNIALNPSDWLSFMLRFTSRSKDEYRSFVELLKVTPIKEIHFEPKQIEVITKILDNVVSDPTNQESVIRNLYNNQYQDLKRTSNDRDIEEFAIKIDTMISKEISLLHDQDLNEMDRLNQEQINAKDEIIDDLTIKLSEKHSEVSQINDKLKYLGDYVDLHQQNDKNKKLFLDNRKKLRNKWIVIILFSLAIYIVSRTFIGKFGAPQTLIGALFIGFIINYLSDKAKLVNIITTKEYRLSKKVYLEFKESNNL